MALTKNKSGTADSFWNHTGQARRRVSDWPEWKRKINITQVSNFTEENGKNKKTRD